MGSVKSTTADTSAKIVWFFIMPPVNRCESVGSKPIAPFSKVQPMHGGATIGVQSFLRLLRGRSESFANDCVRPEAGVEVAVINRRQHNAGEPRGRSQSGRRQPAAASPLEQP